MRAIFYLFRSKRELLIQNCLQKKEIDILKRKNQNKQLKLNRSGRIIFSIMDRISKMKGMITIIKPETVLHWQRQLIKHSWTYKFKNRVGRPPVSGEIKQLILTMKNDNLYWGYKKIQGELLKLGITLDQKTIRNILSDFHRKGKIRKCFTWRKFLRLQMHSIYAMDFFTIDTVLNQRFYVYFILPHKTREIIEYAITKNPTREFVRQQLMKFEQKLDQVVYMIHDQAAQFEINYLAYGIKDIKTSVNAPNMNALAERFVGSIRWEALDNYLLITEKQIMKILRKFIVYYNTKRPHQGIDQLIPMGYKPQAHGRIYKQPILGGLCYHYMRRAA